VSGGQLPLWAEPAPAAAPVDVTVVGTPTVWSGFKRYRLSNGWFIDGAWARHAYHHDWKYSLWEPGGDPSGCAGFRGGGPTLALALAVANGSILCGWTQHGCRATATCYGIVTVHGREYRVYYCDRHGEGKNTTPLDDMPRRAASPA
jgi:hypothetical protein